MPSDPQLIERQAPSDFSDSRSFRWREMGPQDAEAWALPGGGSLNDPLVCKSGTSLQDGRISAHWAL